MAHVKQIYANLCGTWIDVTNCIIDRNENAIKYFDEELLNHEEGSNTSNLFKYDYINIEYGNKAYRIHPSQIQIIL